MVDEKIRVAFRWNSRLVERIDAYAEHVREEMPGLTFNRTAAVRVWLEKALSTVEGAKDGRPKRSRR